MLRQEAKELIRTMLPLSLRKHLSILLNHQKWVGAGIRSWWTKELLRDFIDKDKNEYHRFLWANHLAYAASYEIENMFGKQNIKKSREIFFCDLKGHLCSIGFDPSKDIQSVFEVGCSLGYQLGYMETEVFPSAATLEGVDIDRYAIYRGKDYLQKIGSKARLICDDMGNLNQLLENKIYDIIICTGTLMYLHETEATGVVDSILRHCRVMVGFSGPAHPEIDNSLLEHSVIRERDGSFIHNIDAMIKKSYGSVFDRRWEGSRVVDGHTIYFVFATSKSLGTRSIGIKAP